MNEDADLRRFTNLQWETGWKLERVISNFISTLVRSLPESVHSVGSTHIWLNFFNTQSNLVVNWD